LIGVISKADQATVVEEFFELFKTPWEFYHPRRGYDVILATTDEIQEVDAKLLLIYGSSTKSIDAPLGITSRAHRSGALIAEGTAFLPIYGDILTFAGGRGGASCVTENSEIAGLRLNWRGSTVLRIGYDLFDEIRLLLSVGQPVEHAKTPTLDVHIRTLRNWILNEGIPLVEIPPAPAGHSFTVCLTHDIDFAGIRNHKFDHTMWGFLYRSTVGSIGKLLRGRISLTRFLEVWRAVVSLPFVYLGWLKDFWEPFRWYLDVEKGLEATYFLIPFKGRAGECVPGAHPSRRAAAYDVDGLSDSTAILKGSGCELGVHGIDAWHSVYQGRAELAKIARISGGSTIGIRMHWLLQDANTTSVLEQSGYAYDSSAGYNETIGYLNGTTQVFRPLNCKTLLEIPLHVQDGALFYPNRLDLSEAEAERCCRDLVNNARQFGGVLTVIWHDRSHGPERFWGDFYVRFVEALKSTDAWFATAGHAASWFRKRRSVHFELVETADRTVHTSIRYLGKEIHPPLKIRIYRPQGATPSVGPNRESESDHVDIEWSGGNTDELDRALSRIADCSIPIAASCL
jgi:hypothetical protein